MGCVLEAYVSLSAQSGRARLASGTWRAWTLAAGVRLLSALVERIEEAITGAHADLLTFRAEVDSAGLVGLSVTSGTQIEVEWPADGFLRDVLGFVAATATTPATAPLPPTHRLQLVRTEVGAAEAVDTPSTMAESDARRYVVAYGATVRQLELEIEFTGWQRSGAVDEYLRAERFICGAVQLGELVRYYPDSSVTSAFDRITTPNGYRQWRPARCPWRPRPVGPAQILYRWRHTLPLRLEP